jgi:hypothetical protein
VWFGIFVVLIVEMAEVSPPVGFNLFVLQTMSGKDSNTVARASLPFFFLLVAAVAIITVFPDIVMVLPRMAFAISLQLRDTAMKYRLLKSLALGRPSHSRPEPRMRRPSGTCPPPIRPTIRTARTSSRSPRTSRPATGGKLQIAVHPGASLFKAPEIKRAVQTGQAQMGELLLSIHENEDSLYGIDVVPFVATSFPEAMKLYKASKGAIEKKLAAQGIMLLFACRGHRRASTPRRTSTPSRT